MKRARVVLLVVACAACGLTPTASASGSYGAVVEKGVRGCTADGGTAIVICFEAPSVNARSRSVFLRAWPAASPYFGWGRASSAMLLVRSVSVTDQTPRAGTPVATYVARADLVLRELACTDDFRFHASSRHIGLESFTSHCTSR